MDKIIETIDRYQMLPENCCVIAGVSGGADSMLLLSFLLHLKKERNITIIAAHINHCLRGQESEEDERFVHDFCNQNGVTFRVLRASVLEESKKMGCGIEECGRKIRYQFFAKLAEEYDAKIATAHTLSDHLETVLIYLVRGTGIRGMCGIPPIRDQIVRPLISLTRKEVEDCCKRYGIPYRIDRSNFDRTYTRNKIRLEVVPVLREINPSLETAILRLSEQCMTEFEYLQNTAKQELFHLKQKEGYSVAGLQKLHPAILSRCIIIAVSEFCGIKLEKIHVDLIIKIIQENSGAVTVPGGFLIKIEYGFLKIKPQNTEPVLWENKFNPVKILTETGRQFIIEIIDAKKYAKEMKTNRNLFYHALDYAIINNHTVLRNRRAGDIFHKVGSNHTKSLKKLLNEAKIPAHDRNRLAILANGEKILWIEGFGASNFAAVNEKTKKVVMIFPKECKDDKRC